MKAVCTIYFNQTLDKADYKQWFQGVGFDDRSMVWASFDYWDSMPAFLSILEERLCLSLDSTQNQ